jgi:hypothetical protein
MNSNDSALFLSVGIISVIAIFGIISTYLHSNDMYGAADYVCSSLNYTKATDYTWIPYKDAFDQTFREERFKIECDFKVIPTEYTIDYKYCVEYDKWNKCIDTKYKFNRIRYLSP